MKITPTGIHCLRWTKPPNSWLCWACKPYKFTDFNKTRGNTVQNLGATPFREGGRLVKPLSTEATQNFEQHLTTTSKIQKVPFEFSVGSFVFAIWTALVFLLRNASHGLVCCTHLESCARLRSHLRNKSFCHTLKFMTCVVLSGTMARFFSLALQLQFAVAII